MPEQLVAHARAGWGCVQGQRGAGAAAVKLLGSAETVVPARRLEVAASSRRRYWVSGRLLSFSAAKVRSCSGWARGGAPGAAR